MERDDVLQVKHRDTGDTGDLIRYDPKRKEYILVRLNGEVESVFVLDWEPSEGHREQMYLWLSEKEDALQGRA